MERIEQLAARAAVFKYLSLGFSPPGPIPYPELLPRLREACGFLPECHREVLAPLIEVEIQEGPDEGEYWRLFGPGGVVSPYETEYDPLVAARKGHELADLMGFYTAFGFKRRERERELPDHLAVELEFLSLLLLKLLYARREGMREAEEVTHTAISVFLRDHLGRWVEPFAERVEQATASSAFRALAKLLRAFIGEECRLLDVTPLTIHGTAERPEGAVECPFASECRAGPSPH
jgi:TorA maturation chaperone TorD